MNKVIFNTVKISFIALILIASQNVFAQMANMMPKDGSVISMSKYSFDETVDILKGSIEEQNLMVIYEIDGQKMLRMAGKKIKGMKQIFYFHPKFMKKVIEANKMAGIQIPFKFIVMEKLDGKVIVRYFPASFLLSKYTGEKEAANELDALISKIVKEIKN